VIATRRPATTVDVARHYDELHRIYLDLWGEHLHHGLFHDEADDPQTAARRMVWLVAELARVRPGDRVCDVGCGYGATARELALDYGAKVTGIGISAKQLRHARARTPPGAGLRFHLADWLANPFRDASFDVVIAVECLSHMASQEAFFQEAARTLRPGGRLVVCAWLAREGVGFPSRRLLLEPICREGELAGLATEAEVRAWLSGADLRLESFQDLSRQVRYTWSVSARRVVAAVLRHRRYRRLLFDRRFGSRRFAAAVFRIWAAYRVDAMRYGVFTAHRG
jgi:tocopherol O-methyltransferase